VKKSRFKIAGDPFSATRFFLARLPQTEVESILDCLKATSEIGEEWQRPLRPMTWEMLAEMRDAGMTIGSHTKRHAFLANEGESRVQEETGGSRSDLERRLGIKVRTFAYPGGSFTASVVRSVADAGYRFAFTTCRHRDPQHPLLTIPRTGLWERSCLDRIGRFSPAIMSCQTAGTFHWMSRCTQGHA
jgi:hypothetical protein